MNIKVRYQDAKVHDKFIELDKPVQAYSDIFMDCSIGTNAASHHQAHPQKSQEKALF
jgi:hypothetical protein